MMRHNEIVNPNRLQQQIQFIVEVDKLKTVLRLSYLIGGSRRENSGEHSWHLTVLALILAEHANEKIDLLRVLKMLIIHDIVEIDAGDTSVYDKAGYLTKAARESEAADRIFNLLPPEQANELRALWDEFELRETPEAKFAATLDRLMPLLQNYHNEGKSWREHGVTGDMVLKRNEFMKEGSEALWEYTEAFIRDAIEKEYMVAASEPTT